MSYAPGTSSPFRHNSFAASTGSSSPLSQHQQQQAAMFRPSSSVSSSLGRGGMGSASGGGGGGVDETTRQSNIVAFEWTVDDVKALNSAIQSYQPEDQEHPSHNHEILAPGPVIASGSFKLDVVFEAVDPVPTSSNTPTMDFPSASAATLDLEDEENPAPEVKTLCVYVGNLTSQSGSQTWEFPASIMVGIKGLDQPIGSRHAPVKWVYNFWEEDWTFHPENSFWRGQLPPLSTLLKHPSIEEHDAFVLVIQIHTPFAGESLVLPELPRETWIPRTLLAAMENSLDNEKTGDVKFITRERYDPSLSSSSDATSFTPTNTSYRSSASTSVASSTAASPSNPHPNMVSRKRVVWAHSDVLKARSEYFETMLNSAFAENTLSSGRSVHEINLEGSDFTTVYWLVRYLYTNSLEFEAHEDVRTIYQLANVKNSPHQTGLQEWEWQSVWNQQHPSRTPSGEDDLDTRTIASVSSSAGSFEAGLGSVARPGGGGPVLNRGGSASARAGGGSGLGLIGSPPSGGTRLPSLVGTDSGKRGANRQQQQQASLPYSHRPRGSLYSSPASPAKPSSIPIPSSSRPALGTLNNIHAHSRTPNHPPSSAGTSSRTGNAGPLSPPSPLNHRSSAASSHSHHLHHSLTSLPDPHSHPTTPPPPASALAIYHIASRYSLNHLQALARDQILSSLNLSNAMAFLLASSMYDELHELVEDWLVRHWGEVRGTEEFRACFGEVSGGIWGEDGGRVLLSLCGRLEGPAEYVRR